MIHGPSSIKFIHAQQAKIIHIYENIKIKLYKKKLLRMDRYGPKHVELTPEHQ